MKDTGIENFDWDVLESSAKGFNTKVVLTEEDKAAGVKILCHEPYAQELYDKMKAYERETGLSTHACKDLDINGIYEVRALSISFDEKLIYTEEVSSGVEIVIPFKEFASSIEDLTKGENLVFSAMITRLDRAGGYVGSEKKCVSINYRKELFKNFETNKWFEVKIKKLIKGGYVAMYRDNLECFIPGSHAGANVIREFSKLLGKTINVMVDNYDTSNDLFILSYKKYIKQSMPLKISDLQFGKEYTGTLTNKPYEFGVFVEFEDYYTGLIHSSEFENYSEIKNTLNAGDEIKFYIKNVTKKKNEYRIVLTLNEQDIDSEKRQWDDLRSRTENKTFDYDVDSKSNSIKIHIDGDSYDVTLRRKDLEKNLSLYPKVKVSKVDPVNKSLKFEFVDGSESVESVD